MNVAKVEPEFWRGRRVLLTGHTGFKGGWLAIWLARMGAKVTGVALPPDMQPNLFESADIQRNISSSVMLDIRDTTAIAGVVRQSQPEVVLHLAAQPLVRRSYREPLATFATNIMGTANLLDALRGADGVKAAVIVTTDKVYANREWVHPYREADTLGGHDPYSASKAASEIVIDSYRSSFLKARGVAVASARAGNVIGGGDWSEDRLLPDAIRSWQRGDTLDVRRPAAVRPWQHVLEPVAGYLVLAQRLWHNADTAGAYNFGPPADDTATVREVIERAQRAWYGAAQVAWGDGSVGPHEAGLLALDASKARNVLGVRGRWSTDEAIDRTVRWYHRHASGVEALDLCFADIDDYEAHSAAEFKS